MGRSQRSRYRSRHHGGIPVIGAGTPPAPLEVVSAAAQTNIPVGYSTLFAVIPFVNTVTITLSDASTMDVGVSYAQGAYDRFTPGNYDLVGTLSLPGGVNNTGGVTAAVRVVVAAAKTVVSVAAQTTINVAWNTAFGSVPFVSPVTVTLSDASTRSMVTTYAVGTYIGNETGSYNLQGTLTLPVDVLNPGNVKSAVTVVVPISPTLGINWTSRVNAQENNWSSVCFGAHVNRFVAVSYDGVNRVQTSDDGGITWTIRTIPEANQWRNVCYSSDLQLFCAVSLTGTNRVMTSPDGITWTARAASVANQWASVCWGNGLFVAVAISGSSTNRVMTSPDGTTWTTQVSAGGSLQWFGVDWGNGMFIAVAAGSTSNVNKFQKSTDGITWTAFFSTTQQFLGVRWVPHVSLWVVAAGDGTATARILTSPDGITFTARVTPGDCQWEKLAYGDGMIVCVATTGTGRIMSSTDAINWTLRTAPVLNRWYDVCFGRHKFVSCSFDGTSDRIMTSD